MMSKKRKMKFSLNGDDQEQGNQVIAQTTPKKQQTSKITKVNKSRCFDFNEFEQQQTVSNNKGTLLEANTLDSLGNHSLNNRFGKQIRMPKKQANSKSQSPRYTNPQTLSQKSIYPIITRQQQDVQKSQKMPQQAQQQLSTNYAANIIFQYTQTLASLIFRTLYQDLDTTILNNEKLLSMSKDKVRDSDLVASVRSQAEMFIGLLEILNKKGEGGQNIREEMQEWIIKNLKKINTNPKNQLNVKNPKDLKIIMFAEHRLQELATLFLNNGLQNEALTITNIQDRASHRILSTQNEQLRYCYTCIESYDIKIIPRISWLVDLALSIIYFKDITLQDIVNQIYQKYKKSKIILEHLPSCFLALVLAFASKERKQNIGHQAFIRNIMQEQSSKLQYLHQIFIFYSLQKQTNISKSNYFQTIKQALISKFTSATLFLEFVVYIDISKGQEFQQNLKEYLKNNGKSSQDNNLRLLKLLSAIDEYKIDEQEPLQIIQLKKWRKFKQFEQQTHKRLEFEALSYYVDNFNEIETNIIADKKQIQLLISNNITSFNFLCTFRAIQKKKHLQLLYKLEKKLNRQGEIVSIVAGCITFMEMKLNIFNLCRDSKIASLWKLHRHIEESTANNNRHKIKSHIQRVLQTVINTTDGKMYILNELKQLCPDKSSKQRYFNLLSRQLGYEKDDMILKDSQISQILYILGERSEVYKFVLIDLVLQ